MLDPICSSNQYIVRYKTGALDTMFCSDQRLVRRMSALGSLQGGASDSVEEVVRVPTLLDLDLQSNQLKLLFLSPN